MKPTTTLSIIVLAVAPPLLARPSEAECLKWNSALSICDTSPSTCGSEAPEPTFGQWRYYFSQLLHDDAQAACKARYAFGPYKNCAVLAVPYPGDPNWMGCALDANCDGTIDQYEKDVPQSWIEKGEITREAMCERTPNGPYAHLDAQHGTTGVAGGLYSDAMRRNIREANLARNGSSVRSDSGPSRPPTLVASEFDYLTDYYRYTWLWVDDMLLQVRQPFESAAPNIDHIIPRKDIYGCDCGPNSYANAQVISAKLNIKMSNDSQDPDRVKILERYTLP
jgi:hypothetical protein